MDMLNYANPNHSCPEPELRAIFGRYGTVQTCIVNKDKRHAFVKMLTRKDAELAKTSMEDNRHIDIPLRVSFFFCPLADVVMLARKYVLTFDID